MNYKRAALVTAAAFLGIMLLIAAAVLAVRWGGRRVRNDAVPYPYQWTEKRGGTISLTLDGSAAKGGRWTAESAGDDVVSVSLGETRRGKASATLTPASEGRVELSFALTREEERLAELRLAVETAERDGRLAVTVIDHGERAGQEAVSGGREDHPYTAYEDDAGYLVLRVADSAMPSEEESDPAERWTAKSSDELIAFPAELRTAEGGVEVRLGTHVNGSAEVTVSGEEANVRYVFTVVSDNGALRLSDCAWSDYAPETPMTEEEMNALLSGVTETLTGLQAAGN